MAPVVTVLQLDTDFPRIAGDVGCRDTYVDEIEILRISGASVGQIVSAHPAKIAIAPFEDAVRRARGDVIVTSCGFLSYWQVHLAELCERPFVSSALTALPALCKRHAPREVLTVTFDADSLNDAHTDGHAVEVVGLPKDAHLRQVISRNLASLDVARARDEVVALVGAKQRDHHKHVVLECTNLPPYKAAIAAQTGLPITDILTQIEEIRAGTIRPNFIF